MTAPELLAALVADLIRQGQHCTAEAIHRTGRRLIDERDGGDEGNVFPAAAELPTAIPSHQAKTVKAKRWRL